MSWNGQHQPNHTQVPFWDFIQSLDPNRPGAGVDHAGAGPQFPSGFPFGGGPWAPHGGWGAWAGPGGRGDWTGPWGRRGRRGGRRGDHEEDDPTDAEQDNNNHADEGEDVAMNEKDGSPETMRDTPADAVPDPPESVPSPPHYHHHGPGSRGRGRCGRGGMRGRHGPGFGGFGPHHRGPGHHHHGPHPPPPPYWAPPHGGPSGPGGFPWDFRPMMHAFANHPIAQGLREYIEKAQNASRSGNNGPDANNNDGDVESFVPPVDIFHTAQGWVLHIAVPGAKKEDVGVNWDADKALLSVSGVVYRPGNEEFLQGLVSGERKVGLFQRDVRLPPEGAGYEAGREKDEIDADGIAAKMEDGVLVVSVPIVERDWTDVKKVDIA